MPAITILLFLLFSAFVPAQTGRYLNILGHDWAVSKGPSDYSSDTTFKSPGSPAESSIQNPGSIKEGLDVSPNPIINTSKLVVHTSFEGTMTLRIFDVKGRRMREEYFDDKIVDLNARIDLMNGVYLLVLQAGDKQYTKQVIFVR
jgi:hypothetical protein